MNGRGRWLFVFAGMAALAVLLIGLVLGGGPAPAPAPSAPTPPVAVPSANPTASATAVPTNGPVVSYWVYFARDQLPPVGATIQAHAEQNAVDRTVQRIGTLMRAGAPTPPAGSTNPAALIRQRTTVSGGFTVAVPTVSVRIDGDLATAEFDIEDWGVRGAADTQALVQQLVYTITEEPGVRRAMIVEKGKTSATIDQLVIDKPLSRDDVSGYTASPGTDRIVSEGTIVASTMTTSYTVEETGAALARFVIDVRPQAAPAEGRWLPRFTAALEPARADATGKYELQIEIEGAADTSTQEAVVEKSPLRWVKLSRGSASPAVAATMYRLGLDDARPWRVAVAPGTSGSMRIYVDIGGDPRTVNPNIAVYQPQPAQPVAGTVTIVGAARVFEANVSWRLRDANGQAVASGNTLASLGTSPVWGVFESKVEIPAGVRDQATLEVFWRSPRDGSDQDVVSVTLTIR